MVAAALREYFQRHPPRRPVQPVASPDPSLGLMREDAELLDEIVEDAMRRRQLQSWLPRRQAFAALEALSEKTGLPLNALLDEALTLLLQQRGQDSPP